jgi:hypothetical protein
MCFTNKANRCLDSLANGVIRHLATLNAKFVRSTTEQEAVATWPIGYHSTTEQEADRGPQAGSPLGVVDATWPYGYH